MNADVPVDMPAQACTRCGRCLPNDSPRQLCPYCLLSPDLSEPASTRGSAARFIPPAPEVLQTFFPQLEVETLIGQGGMGAVYRARQRSLGRGVALKILPPEVAAAEGFTDRFAREARALGRLAHPHVVAVFDHGTSGPYAFLVMELVEGIDLRQLMAGGRLSAEEALRIVPQLCDALQYAHRQGVIHRDIKPENILIDEAGRVKITDFGLAKLVASDDDYARTGTRQVMGTLHYMAPEQFERPRDVDHRADLYSLGVVFYELLTGELPLGRFDPPSHKSSAGRQVDYVVLKSLEKDPNRRYASAADIRSDLDRVRSGERDHWERAAQHVGRQVRQASHSLRSAAGSAWINWLELSVILLHVIFYASLLCATLVIANVRGPDWLGAALWTGLGLWVAAYALDHLTSLAPLPAPLASVGRPVTALARLPWRLWNWLSRAGATVEGLRLPVIAAAWCVLAIGVLLTLAAFGADDDYFAGAIVAFLAAWLLTRWALPRGGLALSASARWLLYPTAAGGLLMMAGLLLLWPLVFWMVLTGAEPAWIEHLIGFTSGHAPPWNSYQLMRAHVVGASLAETSWMLLLASIAAISPATVRWLARPLLDDWQGGGRWWVFTFCFVAFAISVSLWSV